MDNSLFISENRPQSERLERLNQIAIHQMTILVNHPRLQSGKPLESTRLT